MPKFRLYAGLGGSFGGANYHGTFEVSSEDEAAQMAYDLAREEYESYEGLHGIMSWEDCEQALMESENEFSEFTENDVNDYYLEEVEGWIDYYAEPAPDDAPVWEEDLD